MTVQQYFLDIPQKKQRAAAFALNQRDCSYVGDVWSHVRTAPYAVTS